MFNFIEKGIRGGISMITKKYAEANNKYLKEYNPKLPSKYIIYLDFNNLYGSSMAEPMPLGGFHWIMADRFLSETEKRYPKMFHISLKLISIIQLRYTNCITITLSARNQ